MQNAANWCGKTKRTVRARPHCGPASWSEEEGGLGVCPPPVLTDPEAPYQKVLWQTCPVVSGSPALDMGLQGHRRPRATQTQ